MKKMELYIHIPFCARKCDYCDFLSMSASPLVQQEYVRALLNEIKYRSYDCHEYEVTSIFIGGGTPSILKANVIDTILQEVYRYYHIHQEAEISIECNPGTLEREKLVIYKLAGMNRLSIGLQSTNNHELQELGRIHTYEDFLHSYDVARKVGYANINIDLMSGLPLQSLASYETTLKNVLRLKPEHISAYSLIVEPGTPFYQRYAEDEARRARGEMPVKLPCEATERQMYQLTKDMLEAGGYVRYEISNYAKPGYECRHNIGYWRRVEYIGLGLGASSLFQDTRYNNTTDIEEYCKGSYPRMDEIVLDRKAQMEEFMFLGLRMADGISRQEFLECFGAEIDAPYGDVIEKMVADGYMKREAGRIFFTDAGIDVSNRLLAEFLL